MPLSYFSRRTIWHKNTAFSVVFLVIAFLSVNSSANAQALDKSLKTSQTVMNDFMDKRFGMFIHFGPVTLRATEIGWSRNKEVPAEDYDSLYKEFNPALFNAEAWVKTAKDAGMKYLTITSKHHDGFCLWPTAYSSYNIMNSPFKRDIVGELATACKKYDIAFCIYFTILDWHDPNYPIHSPHDTTHNVPGDMQKFQSTMRNELREIITKYDPYMLWFDGNWEKPWTEQMAVDMYTYLKSLKKDIIINNRLGKEMAGGENKQIDVSKMIGDYDTPEQTIGRMNMVIPWESCITICNQWAWKPNDNMKTLKECVQTLIKTSGGNGNLLLNVGPMMDGRIEARQVERLREMGEWLSKYGNSIYGTKGGPYHYTDVYASTRKGNKIYIHVFERKSAILELPALPDVKIQKAYFMNGNALKISQQSGQGIMIDLPATLPDQVSSVIVLELDKNAEQIPVIKN